MEMQYLLFDSSWRRDLFPFTHTRPVADIRCGILTFRERWELLLHNTVASLCPEYMSRIFSQSIKAGPCILINGALWGNAALAQAIQSLTPGQKLVQGNTVLAAHLQDSSSLQWENWEESLQDYTAIEVGEEIHLLRKVWEIFSLNDRAIREDFALLTTGKQSAPLPEWVSAIAPENIFIEAGAQISPCIINAATGPVYIGKDAEIMEGCMLRGPIALGEHACLKMGAKVYGATTLGPGCKVGGEVNNVVFFANSNKGHDGFLGNAVIGEWCNLGADTNCSNLKNNYDEVKIWSEAQNSLIKTGLQFCGLLMGDHSKCGINTMFNTGTVVGVSCNIFGSGFPEKFVPSFTWGGAEQTETYKLDKALDTATRMMARRNKALSPAEIDMFAYLFTQQS